MLIDDRTERGECCAQLVVLGLVNSKAVSLSELVGNLLEQLRAVGSICLLRSLGKL